jgi:hypothetical protein
MGPYQLYRPFLAGLVALTKTSILTSSLLLQAVAIATSCILAGLLLFQFGRGNPQSSGRKQRNLSRKP